MFHGGGGGHFHHHGGQFDADEVLGKVYDNRVVARLPKYLAPVRGWVGIGVVGILVRTVATLALPYLVGVATDHVIRGDYSSLTITAIIFVVAALAMWGG